MWKKILFALSLAPFLAVPAMPAAEAQGTPDGETPANEAVCDDLFFATPGLYGLCVAFCEAQDCEATFDPSTGEVTFAQGCRASNPKVLANYNRRKTAADPEMPCLAIAEDECPCWTEEELDSIADDTTLFCGENFTGRTQLVGLDAGGGVDIAIADEASGNDPAECFYRENTPAVIVRSLILDDDEFDVCRASLLAECADRGF